MTSPYTFYNRYLFFSLTELIIPNAITRDWWRWWWWRWWRRCMWRWWSRPPSVPPAAARGRRAVCSICSGVSCDAQRTAAAEHDVHGALHAAGKVVVVWCCVVWWCGRVA